MILAPHFQSPILKYFYDLESDVVSAQHCKILEDTEDRKKFKGELGSKGIEFSEDIVHFDGISFHKIAK